MNLLRYIFPLLILLLLFNQCYLSKQGAYLLRYNSMAEDIDTILRERELQEEEKEMLLIVKEIKQYSENRVGLRSDKNFTRYIEIEKDYLVDVVSACEKDRFEPYIWEFPFFGSFPYKGYYEREDAEKEARKLRDKGLDVMIRKVDAFSTLGFFSDPVYSFLKDYSVYSLASMIIHEQTHATIFLKNQIQFNEELATFVGNEGARQFIRDKYGADSSEYREIEEYNRDLETLFTLFRLLYTELNAVYETEDETEYKLRRKEEIFIEFKKRVKEDFEKLFKTDTFRYLPDMPLNNAYVLYLNRYTGDLELFYELYDHFNHDLETTVLFFKKLKKYRSDPKEYIRNYIARGNLERGLEE